MAEVTTSGDSMQATFQMNSDGTIAKDATQGQQVPNMEPQQPISTDEPVKQDGPKQQGPLADAEEPAKAEGEKVQKDYKAHKMIIDLMEDKFTDLESGRIDDEELRNWFDSHPEYADIANRSKRLKDKFRPLMERDQAAANNPEISSKRSKQTEEGDEIDDADPKSASADGPIKKSEFFKLMEEYESQKLEKGALREKSQAIREYAVEKGLKDDEVKTLEKNALALMQANTDWSIDESLDAAYRAIWQKKGQPVNVSTGKALPQEEPKDGLPDLTNWTPLMKVK